MNSSKQRKKIDQTKTSSITSSPNYREQEHNLIVRLLPELSFAEVSHVAFTGHSQELKSFFKQHAGEFMFVGHPFSFAPQKRSVAEFYAHGSLKSEMKAFQVNGPEVFLYIRDFLVTFYFLLKSRRKFHVYVGVDPLNALAGLILKQLGFVQVTVFYVIDYVPVRFKNLLLNYLYRSFDRSSVSRADFTWNLTASMTEARERIGIKKEHTHQIIVPTGMHSERIDCYAPEDVDKTNVVFLSHLREGQGIDLVLEALPLVVKKIPSVNLIVIGTGPLEARFKEEAKKRNLSNNVTFLGYIENHDEVEDIIAKCRVGIAPYVPFPSSFTWFADPGKPKVYLGCGVPVVITRVPEVASEIAKRRAGIAINYDAHELAQAIITVLTDQALYEEFRANAVQFAKELSWESVYIKALSELLKKHSKN